MPSRREDLEKLVATHPQTPQSAEWEIGKPSLQKIVIYMVMVIFLGLGIFWRWSSISKEVRATATAEVQARSIIATIQAVGATQQVEATAQARTTKMAEAVATAVEAMIAEIRVTAAAETPMPSPHPLTHIAAPVDMPILSGPPVSSQMLCQYVEKLPDGP